MVRPLYPLLWGFITGIFLEHYGRSSASRFPILLLLFALLGVLYLFCRVRNAQRLSAWILIGCAVFIGMTRYALFLYLPVNHLSHFLRDELVTVEGYLAQPPESWQSRRYLTISVTALEQGEIRRSVTGKIRITLTGNGFANTGPKRFEYGRMIRTRLRLRLPRSMKDFEYREYLRRRGVYLVGTLRHDRYILKFNQHKGNRFLKNMYTLQGRLLAFLDSYTTRPSFLGRPPSFAVHPSEKSRAGRAAKTYANGQHIFGILRAIGGQEPEHAIQVIKALTLGQKRAITPSVRESFRNAGMYHFLVVSGLHIGILAWVCHQLLTFGLIPRRYWGLFMSVFLVAYAGLTGFQFPVLRAVFMVLVFYLSFTCNRPPDPVYSLAFTAAAILFIFPFSAFEASFQMTVAATASILFFFRCLRPQPWFQWLLHTHWWGLRIPAIAGLASFAAILGISPLTAYYFERIYPASLFSTLLAFPLVNLLLPASLFPMVCSLCIPWAWLHPLLSFPVFLAGIFLRLAMSFPNSGITLPQPSLLILVLYYLTLYRLFTLQITS